MKQAQKIVYLLSTFLLVGSTHTGYCNAAKDLPAKKAGAAIKKIEKSVNPEKIKEKFHQAADALDQDKVHESIDRVADYLDKDRMKDAVDAIADYFDKDQIKAFIDYAAEYLDRERIKEMIDLIADAVDREQVKTAVDQVIGSVDKEQIKQTFDQSIDQLATSFQQATSHLEQQIKQLGSNKNKIEELVQKYNWNQWIPDKVSYGPATLSNLTLGGYRKAIIVKPGQKIEGEVECALNRKDCSLLSIYRVVLGIKNKGGQTTVFNHFGLRAGKETDHFVLTAPQQKGIYQVGFRVVEAAREGTAIEAFETDDSAMPEPAAIGVIIVS